MAVTAVRGCGCDIDIGVFGHIWCWTQGYSPYAKHFTCPCAHCPCTCHKDRQPCDASSATSSAAAHGVPHTGPSAGIYAT